MTALGVENPAGSATGTVIRVGDIVLSPRPFETELLDLKTLALETGEGGCSDVATIASALDLAERMDAALVTCRRPEADRATISALQESGFRVIECLLTLGRPLGDWRATPSTRVRQSRPGDADAVASIGASVFRCDRFHADPDVPNEAADRLKAAWARNSVNGRADAVFVAEEDGKIGGFNACLLRGDTAIIDLIGVADGMQRRGIGRDLVEASLSHYAAKASRMIVGTQSSNHLSLAMYQSAGFRIQNSALTLHVHLN